MGALSPRILDIPERMKTALMQYMGAVLPSCSLYFSSSQNTGKTPTLLSLSLHHTLLLTTNTLSLPLTSSPSNPFTYPSSYPSSYLSFLFSFLFCFLLSFLPLFLTLILPPIFHLSSPSSYPSSNPFCPLLLPLLLPSSFLLSAYGEHHGVLWFEAIRNSLSGGQEDSRTIGQGCSSGDSSSVSGSATTCYLMISLYYDLYYTPPILFPLLLLLSPPTLQLSSYTLYIASSSTTTTAQRLSSTSSSLMCSRIISVLISALVLTYFDAFCLCAGADESAVRTAVTTADCSKEGSRTFHSRHRPSSRFGWTKRLEQVRTCTRSLYLRKMFFSVMNCLN